MVEFEILKGTLDSEPLEQIRINNILKIITENFEKFGFRPFDTPIIEYLETLTLKYDDDAEIVEEIFKLTDRGSRKLGLRYDLTTPLSRFVASKKQLKKPFKRYQIGKVFRDGPIKKGRLREFIQCDGDVVGIEGVEIESELLLMFYQTYKQLKIDSVIELNNNKILKGALLQVGFKKEDLSSVILSIDKLKKIGLDEVLKEIENKGIKNQEKAKDAIDILSKTSFKEIEQLAQNDLLIEGINELKLLSFYLNEFEVEYRLNFSMSRGLDIYTGNIWEAYDINQKISSSIGSGGRYDKVISEYANLNEIIPAVGVSFGLVPILAVLEDNSNLKQGLTDVLIVPLKKELVIESQKLAQKIRNNENKNVEVFYSFKIKKAFDYCDYLDIEELIIIGNKDLENKEYIRKNLKTKEEEKFNF